MDNDKLGLSDLKKHINWIFILLIFLLLLVVIVQSYYMNSLKKQILEMQRHPDVLAAEKLLEGKIDIIDAKLTQLERELHSDTE